MKFYLHLLGVVKLIILEFKERESLGGIRKACPPDLSTPKTSTHGRTIILYQISKVSSSPRSGVASETSVSRNKNSMRDMEEQNNSETDNGIGRIL